jgi:type IV pilus biogenesis protein CpaD/CtpE
VYSTGNIFKTQHMGISLDVWQGTGKRLSMSALRQKLTGFGVGANRYRGGDVRARSAGRSRLVVMHQVKMPAKPDPCIR